MDLLDRLRLDVPVAQAGMGGGLAGPELATAVAAAGGLGTLGLAPVAGLRAGIRHVRDGAAGRAVAVNLLMPFVRRAHVDVCVEERIDIAVMAFGIDRAMITRLTEGGVLVFVMVGTEGQARQAIDSGADGLIAQGCEAGGHIAGDTLALTFLPRAIEAAGDRPVLLAGGIANAQDTRAALAAGADGVVAGTRFLLTHEARAHPEYQRRILAADKTFRHDTVRAWLARSASRRGERRDPAVVSRGRPRQAGAAGDKRRQRDTGQTSRPSPSAPSTTSGAALAGVLPDRADGGNARLHGRPRSAVCR